MNSNNYQTNSSKQYSNSTEEIQSQHQNTDRERYMRGQQYPPVQGGYPVQQVSETYAMQPQNIVMMNPAPLTPPPNYFMLSLLTCLFCCWPVSIFALRKSSEVNSANAVGDFERAQRASQAAKRYSIISVISGIIVEIAFIIFFVIVVLPRYQTELKSSRTTA